MPCAPLSAAAVALITLTCLLRGIDAVWGARSGAGLLRAILGAASTGSSRVRLDAAASLRRFFADIAREVTGASSKFDAVIWVTPGTRFPAETPVLTERLIDTIHAEGQIPRTENGRVEGIWFHVFSSQIAGFGGASIKEIFERTTPQPGRFIERDAGSSGPIITRPDLIAERMGSVAASRIRSAAIEEADTARHINFLSAVERPGVVMSRSMHSEIWQAVQQLRQGLEKVGPRPDVAIRSTFTSSVDPTAILDFRSDRNGTPLSYRYGSGSLEAMIQRLSARMKAGPNNQNWIEQLALFQGRLHELGTQFAANRACTHGVLRFDEFLTGGFLR